MDDGIVRREPTKRAALEWAMGLAARRRILPGRKRQNDGFYEYFIGADREDRVQVWIARGDAAVRSGFDVTQTPLYPYQCDPNELVERDAELATDQDA